MKIGDKIRYQRIKNEWTQKTLAEKLGIKQNTLSDYERNITTISVNVIEKLADVFGIEQSYFVDETEPSSLDKRITNRMILEDMLDNLIERKIITDPNNIDKSTLDMLIQIMRKDIEDKLKKQL